MSHYIHPFIQSNNSRWNFSKARKQPVVGLVWIGSDEKKEAIVDSFSTKPHSLVVLIANPSHVELAHVELIESGHIELIKAIMWNRSEPKCPELRKTGRIEPKN